MTNFENIFKLELLPPPPASSSSSSCWDLHVSVYVSFSCRLQLQEKLTCGRMALLHTHIRACLFCLFLFAFIYVSQPKTSLWFSLQRLSVGDDRTETRRLHSHHQSLQQRCCFEGERVVVDRSWSETSELGAPVCPGMDA